MRPIASILFKPLSMASFRWGGEFSPQVRGPQSYARSRPVPLPSTITGTLAGLALSLNRKDLCVDAHTDIYSNTYRGLNQIFEGKDSEEKPSVVFRGPYIYVGSPGYNIVCALYGEESLLCISSNREVKLVQWLPTTSTGIALDSLSRTTMRGMIYTIVYHDLNATINIIARKYGLSPVRSGVLVEVYSRHDEEALVGDYLSRLKTLDSLKTSMGAEQRPFEIRVLEENPVYGLVADLGDECLYWHIVSPVLLPPERLAGGMLERPLTDYARSLLVKVIGLFGLDVCGENIVPCRIGDKIVFSSISLGYDMCLNRRRPALPAVLPGAGFYARPPKGRDALEIYMRGGGKYSMLGWGTVLPLRIGELEEAVQHL